MEMQEKKVPWWRRALNYAIGGIRSGFGLFPRPAITEPVEPLEEGNLIDRPIESLEVETELIDQPNPEAVPAAAETVAANTLAAEPVLAQAIEAEPQPADAIASVDAAETVEENLEADDLPVEAAVETAPTVSNLPPTELPVAAAIEPPAAPEQEASPPAEPEAALDTKTEPESEPVAEVLSAVDPLPVAEITSVEEPFVTEESDPLLEQSVEPVLETAEAESDSESIEPLPEQPAAPAPAAEEVLDPEPFAAAEPQAAPVTPPAAVESEPVSISDSASPIAPAAEAPATEAAEPDPIPETPPPPAHKPFIKLESRDDEANLSPFSVVVEQVYDGPLDLLLDLIRKQDIDIYDIPIAKITAQFLAYVNQLKASDVDVAGEFIYIASLLIHIKSKMLLPRSPAGPEDAAEDPRRELVERLLEHERFKNAAQMLQQKQMLEAATWTNPGFREFQDDVAAEPEIAADTVDLVRIFRDILERIRSRPVFNVDEDAVTVGQMIQFLARRLTMEDKPIALRRLLSHTRSERGLIAIFLALLELVRLQAVLLRQDRAFSEIFVKKHTGFDAVMNEGLANAHDDWK
jgi:segregation and condensation protein A